MKIEKVNENQIRCTLTREDLERRHMRLSELAYGTDNARNLFREMMKFAYAKYGFEVEDSPLMIEAVPVSSDSIILLITKVEYPEELDTRFSRFSDTDLEDLQEDYGDLYYGEKKGSFQASEARTANEVIRSFDDIKSSSEGGDRIEITRLFRFRSLEQVMELSQVLRGFYDGENSLYKSGKGERYYLVMKQSDHSPADFNRICNITTEFGVQENLHEGQNAFFNEHYQTILKDHALQTLGEIQENR